MIRSFQTSVSSLENWKSESVAQRRVSQKPFFIFLCFFILYADCLYFQAAIVEKETDYILHICNNWWWNMMHALYQVKNLSIVLIELYVQYYICNSKLFQVHENLARVSESFICVRIEAIINFLLYTVLYTNMSLSVEYYAAVKLWIDAVKVSAKAVSCRSIIENFPSWSIIENGFSHLRLTRITQLQLRPALRTGITSRL